MHIEISIYDSIVTASILISTQVTVFYIANKFFIPNYFNSNKKKRFIHITLLISFTIILNLIATQFELNFFKSNENYSNSDAPYILLFTFKLIIYIVTIWICISFYFIKKDQKTQKEMDKLKAEKTLSELKFLKTQINPHFLFNALNNIYTISYMEDKSAPDKIAQLSEMLRYVIYDCNSDFVSLEKELIYLQNYIEFQKLKTESNQQIQIETNIENEDVKIAPMIFMPFIENAFKHSKIHKETRGFVSISIFQDKQQLIFKIKNTLPSIKTKSNPKSSGVGIENLKNRLKLTYGNKANIYISETNKHYCIKLNIQLND